MIELAESSKFKNDLCGVKIRLFELKKDYVRAFTEHLNHPEHTKYVFLWLTETFDMLEKEEIEWKRQMGFEIITEEDGEEDEESKSGGSNDSDDD